MSMKNLNRVARGLRLTLEDLEAIARVRRLTRPERRALHVFAQKHKKELDEKVQGNT